MRNIIDYYIYTRNITFRHRFACFIMVITPDHPKIDDWECLPLIDFGITLLNTIPSKRLNLAHLPETEVQNLRITNEEWNLAISPLQIIRGFAALYILADGKCKIQLSNLISKVLFGMIGPLGKAIHEVLNDLCTNYLKSLSKGVIEIYFEENHLLKFDNRLMEYIEKYYGAESQGMEMTVFDSEEPIKKEVVQTMCFQMNPNGQTIVNEMNKNIKEATQGAMEYVVRRDLPPKQGTRLVLITSFNSTFYWKPPDQITEIKGYRCDGLFRTDITRDGVRVMELDSEIDNLRMYLFQPRMLSMKDFLKSLNAKKLQRYINQIDKAPTKQSVIIPCFSITSPVGLRSVFASCNPLYHFIFKNKHPQFPYPCIARIFSPDKAEFGMIYGKKSQENYGPFHIYPLWDYYHRTKIVLKTGQRESKRRNDEEMPVVTFTQRTMKDETAGKKYQRVAAVTGRMMIIEDQTGIDRKHYIVGILENGNDENFGGKTIISSLSKSKKLNRKKKGNSTRSSAIGSTGEVRNNIDRNIPQSKEPLQHQYGYNLLKNTMKQTGIQRSTRKNERSQQKSSKRRHSMIEKEFNNMRKKSSTNKFTKINQQHSKKDETTQCDKSKDDNNDQNNISSKTQLSTSSQHSRRFPAGAEKSSKAFAGEILNEKTIKKLKATIPQRKHSIVRLLKGPEISLADKRDIIMAEQYETHGINSYFVVKDRQVRDAEADIIFDTPFLYMVVSKSEMGRLLVVSMGRFTNIQETNPPENMYDRDTSVILTDDNNN
ncbi:Serpin (serine protease inhibitor) family protein [Acanthocheilonema viteae]